MSFFSWLSDRLVLCPSKHAIETEDLKPETISTPFGTVESWYCDSSERSGDDYDAHVIKFPGAGGRAERSSPHPFEMFESARLKVWTINHHGYGNSSGNATLQKFAETCDAVWTHINDGHSPRKIFAAGNSLGCVSALYLTDRYPVDGLFIRNPVPLSHLIKGRPRYNWWNFGGGKWVADQIPAQLDAVENATRSTCPAVIVQSERDRMVPCEYQDLILKRYAGDLKKFIILGADHHHRIPIEQEDDYFEVVDWFQEKVGLA